jgi:eukaryotic-like serine/threonine-protein kinase
MAESKAEPQRLSAPEFLTALEGSGVLPAAQWQTVQKRFASRIERIDSLALAKQLVEEGTLTEFQARRLLLGHKGLDFGRYVLLDHVGRGARGRVYKARHRLMDRVVALKVVSGQGAMHDSAFSRFFREMKIVGLLDHPNVVRAIDADLHEGCPYIVMEYLEGADLERVCARRGPLPPDEVASYMAQVSRGLAHAHEKGVIHRDIKPTNLFLLDSGTVKVLDLGFGELVGQTAPESDPYDTDLGVVVGTTDFMSPEQVKQRPIDARSDLFSLGCTMYRLLTGSYAFPGITREDRLIKRIRERHQPIIEVRPGLPERLVAIVDRLLASQPNDRFGSAVEAAEALEELIVTPEVPSRGTSTKRAAKSALADAPAVPPEPEAAVDWSVIESALRPGGHSSRQAPDRLERTGSRSPLKKGITSHRKALEGEGEESGRDVQKKYRNELIQMNRAMAELRSTESEEDSSPKVVGWLEWIGEKLGDFLAEPSASSILIFAILAVLAVIALVLAVALG